MSVFNMPKLNCDDIVADIKRRMANRQTVTEDDLRRLTGADYPQVILPLDMLTKLLEQSAALKEENERLKDDLVSKMIAKEERIDALSERCADAEAEVCRLDRQVNALKTKAKARVAELEGLLRDIKKHDIDETAKRILDGGRKFNYSLPLNIRERIAAALKEPANEG